jgi:hypothetical protein
MIKVDYRQYPSYPQAYFSHLMLGFIASLLGAVFVPSLIHKEYLAVTVLTVAASQFREIREIERTSLTKLDTTEIVSRGAAYIEDIAKKFESRNYAAILCSIFVSALMHILACFINQIVAAAISFASGIILIFILNKFMKSKSIGRIADVSWTPIVFDGPFLMMENKIVANVGLTRTKEIIEKSAFGIKLHPYTKDGINVISNIGQRQAVLHNVSARLGIRKDDNEPELAPVAKRVEETGDVVMMVMPIIRDYERLLRAIKETPVLESAKH